MKRLPHGFTLIEVLLATSVLAAGLALALATLRAASVSVQRAEEISASHEHVRAVEGFLRRRLGSALAVSFGEDEGSGQRLRFIGEPERMLFVADLPAYLGQGGPGLHDLALHHAEDGSAWLGVGFAVIPGGQTRLDTPAPAPERLVEDVRRLQLRYRGREADGQPGPWREWWEEVDALPLQVEIVIDSAGFGPWPPLLVTLPQGGAGR